MLSTLFLADLIFLTCQAVLLPEIKWLSDKMCTFAHSYLDKCGNR